MIRQENTKNLPLKRQQYQTARTQSGISDEIINEFAR